MTDAKDSLPPRRRLLAPVLLILLLTALLHLLVIHWGRTYFDHSTSDQAAQSTISVTLRPLPLPQQPVSLPTAAKPKPKPKVRKPHPVPPQPETTVTAAPTTTSVIASETPSMDSAPAPVMVPEPQTAPQTKPLAADKPVADDNGGTHYQIDLPPSAALSFDVHAFSDNLDWFGSSTLTWKTDGMHYTIDGEVYARFFAKVTFLTFTSSGDINEFGIAPELYTEKKRNRASSNTHFDRERNLVSFSASTATYPRVGGEQDRASLIWQLAAIGRGDSEKFAAGKVIDLFVAGVRDGEVWRMQVVDREDIRLLSGHVQAWHVVRQPRPGSYEQRLDIWLAASQQWYPVRLRFTETNGDYLEMSLSNLKTL